MLSLQKKQFFSVFSLSDILFESSWTSRNFFWKVCVCVCVCVCVGGGGVGEGVTH